MVLCGGAGLRRGRDRYLAEQTGIPTRLAVDPLTTVVQGALVAIENFERWRPYWQASEDV